jgi:hypothetical protein
LKCPSTVLSISICISFDASCYGLYSSHFFHSTYFLFILLPCITTYIHTYTHYRFLVKPPLTWEHWSRRARKVYGEGHFQRQTVRSGTGEQPASVDSQQIYQGRLSPLRHLQMPTPPAGLSAVATGRSTASQRICLR